MNRIKDKKRIRQEEDWEIKGAATALTSETQGDKKKRFIITMKRIIPINNISSLIVDRIVNWVCLIWSVLSKKE